MNEARYRDAERRLWESFGLAPTEKRVHLEHSDVDVRIQELGEGPPVLFVHGAANSGVSWAGLVARLQGSRCVMLDRPGCGLSDPLRAPFQDIDGLETFADTFLVDVLDAMGFGSADLVATSFGGYMALRAAAAHPERIGRIVEFGWTTGAPMSPQKAIMRIASIPALARMMTAIPVNERAVRMMFRQIGLKQALAAGRVPREVIECYLALLRDTNTMRNELTVNRRLMSPMKGLDALLELPPGFLATIETPIYFLWGEDDPFGGADIAPGFVSQIPHAQLELLPGTGHAVWIDDPDYAAKTTARFLAPVP